MLDNACTYHMKINIYKTPKKMITVLHCRCVVSILPKCSPAVLPLIVFLTGSASDQVYGTPNNVSVTIVGDERWESGARVTASPALLGSVCVQVPTSWLPIWLLHGSRLAQPDSIAESPLLHNLVADTNALQDTVLDGNDPVYRPAFGCSDNQVLIIARLKNEPFRP